MCNLIQNNPYMCVSGFAFKKKNVLQACLQPNLMEASSQLWVFLLCNSNLYEVKKKKKANQGGHGP